MQRDDLGVRSEIVEEAIFEDDADVPSLVRLEGLTDFLPCERVAVDDDVVWPAEVTLLSPDEPSRDLVPAQAPAGPVRVLLEVLPADLGFGALPEMSEELIDVGVVGSEAGEVEPVTDRDTGFLELQLNTRRGPPQPGHELVRSAVEARDHERRRRIGQFGVSGDGGNPSIGATVAELPTVE